MPSAGLVPSRASRVVQLLASRAVQLLALSAMLAFFTAQLVGALTSIVPLLVVASAGGLALELFLQYKNPRLTAVLGKIRFDVTVRQLLRDALLLIGLFNSDDIGAGVSSPLTVALIAFYALHFACQAAAILVRRARQLPFVTRNVDASALRLTDAPPRILARRQSHRLLTFVVPATTGLLLTALTTDLVWGAVGVGLSIALMGGGCLYLASWLLPRKRAVGEQEALRWLDAWLAGYQPTVALYFSGGTTSAYQANMWLSTLSELDGKPLIVLRERFMVQKIAATDVPVLCIPRVTNMYALEDSTLRMMLHPANAAKTSQVLRIPTIKHAFINHGESDKLSSCNPYAKAYDEVWVAGPAARERYQLADIGVDDGDVVEVGRPQLSPIQAYAGPPSGAYTTVLYAPTWEGWDGNPGNTSVVLAGENIVRHLLADDSVRLLYKPHPMTGSQDPSAGAADQRIRAMIQEANTRRSGARPGPEAARELARRTAELDALTSKAFRVSADELERMRLQGAPDGDREAAVTEATEAWEAAYWASFPEWEHRIVIGARPAIFTCFNQADLLISDVSSVVSDWLYSDKPYAVANTSGMSEAEFRDSFPTVSAAAILAPDADTVPALLKAVRDPELDRFAEARAKLKERLLGPSDPPSIDRFNAAVRALCEQADARRVRMATRPAETPPGQLTEDGEPEPDTAADLGDTNTTDTEEVNV